MLSALFLYSCLTLGLCSQPLEPFLCLESASIWLDKEAFQYVLSAKDCHNANKEYFLTHDGKIVSQNEVTDAANLLTPPLFASELSCRSMLEFLKPFMGLIEWASLRNNGLFLDHKTLAHFPLSFWNEISPGQAAQLLAKVPDIDGLVELINTLSGNGVRVKKFIYTITNPISLYCHGPSEGKLCYPDDSIVVCSTAARNGNGSPRGIFRYEAHMPIFLWRKLFTDDEPVVSGQPLYIYSKMR